MDRHQPARVLGAGVERIDAFQRLLERWKDRADRIELRLRRRGQSRRTR